MRRLLGGATPTEMHRRESCRAMAILPVGHPKPVELSSNGMIVTDVDTDSDNDTLSNQYLEEQPKNGIKELAGKAFLDNRLNQFTTSRVSIIAGTKLVLQGPLLPRKMTNQRFPPVL